MFIAVLRHLVEHLAASGCTDPIDLARIWLVVNHLSNLPRNLPDSSAPAGPSSPADNATVRALLRRGKVDLSTLRVEDGEPTLQCLLAVSRIASLSTHEVLGRGVAFRPPVGLSRSSHGSMHRDVEFDTEFASSMVNSWNEQGAIKLLRRAVLRTASQNTAAFLDLLARHAQRTLFPVRPETFASSGLPPTQVSAVVVNGAEKGCRSLVAVRPVPAFTALLIVPHRELFNRFTAASFSVLGRLLMRQPMGSSQSYAASLGTTEDAFLVIVLLFECRAVGVDRSHWHGLLEECPADFPGMPLSNRLPHMNASRYWSEEDLALLSQGLTVADDIELRQTQTRRFAATARDVIRNLCDRELRAGGSLQDIAASRGWTCADHLVDECYNDEAVFWARCVFDSRALLMHYESNSRVPLAEPHADVPPWFPLTVQREENASRCGGDALTLAPVADMINHSSDVAHVITRRTTGDVNDCVVAPSDSAGLVFDLGGGLEQAQVPCEVVMSYGPLQSWETLMSFGFVAARRPTADATRWSFSPHDVMPFPLDIADSLEDATTRRGAWQRSVLHRVPLLAKFALSPFVPAAKEGPARIPTLLQALVALVLAECSDLVLRGEPHACQTDADDETARDFLNGLAILSHLLASVDMNDVRSVVSQVVLAITASFGTTLEEDYATLNREETDNNATYHHLMGTRVACSIKQIARDVSHWADHHSPR